MKQYFDLLLHRIQSSSKNIPVAALLVYKNQVVVFHVNGTDPLSHAELLVLKEGIEILGPHMKDAILYVTLEPCAMCRAAISLSGIKTVYFGAYNDKGVEDANVMYYGGFYERECGDVIKAFFRKKKSDAIFNTYLESLHEKTLE